MFKHTRGQDKFININEDLLIDLCENCLIDYFAKALIELETKDKEYKSLIRKQENILDKYSNLRDVLEDNKVIGLNKQEIKYLIRYLDYKCQSDLIEQREIFYKGLNVSYEIFRKIGIIKD